MSILCLPELSFCPFTPPAPDKGKETWSTCLYFVPIKVVFLLEDLSVFISQYLPFLHYWLGKEMIGFIALETHFSLANLDWLR
jgi:hypothetical protein